MPHQCVRCNTFHEDDSERILKGCSCGGKLFFYVRKEKLDKANEVVVNLSEDEKSRIEKDVLEIAGFSGQDEPVVLDMESVRVSQSGKYELDLVNLMKGEPLVYKVGEGKYIFDLEKSFGSPKRKG